MSANYNRPKEKKETLNDRPLKNLAYGRHAISHCRDNCRRTCSCSPWAPFLRSSIPKPLAPVAAVGVWLWIAREGYLLLFAVVGAAFVITAPVWAHDIPVGLQPAPAQVQVSLSSPPAAAR